MFHVAKYCSRCGEPRDRGDQRYCRRCHRQTQAEWRKRQRLELAELRALETAVARAALRTVRKKPMAVAGAHFSPETRRTPPETPAAMPTDEPPGRRVAPATTWNAPKCALMMGAGLYRDPMVKIVKDCGRPATGADCERQENTPHYRSPHRLAA